jgi:hypothetical protein
MPGFLGGSSGSSGGAGGEIRFPAEFIDPVTKLRVSEPQTLMDTDFEYGLQPTKWETVELINNTPSFFSASGDTTIPNISEMTTTAGSREIKITTGLPHSVAVGIPINVTGTKSLTADGSYIINSIPDAFTFTYLCKQNQLVTASILDLYTSIITGQFFQGSQIRISDSEGIVTNAQGQSTLTLKTDAPHGFGVNTPFYFLNLNSTISQSFDASNTGAKTFDSSNTATAQSFDGSNSVIQYAFDLTNSAVGTGGAFSNIASVNTSSDTFTVTHGAENFVGAKIGTPLYYSIVASSGFFFSNPRGVVYLASNDALGSSSSEFKVSVLPGGTAIDLTVSMTGSFRKATLATTFAGNNTDTQNELLLPVTEGNNLSFDGSNTAGSISTVNSTSTGSAIIQMQNQAGSGVSTGLVVGSMVLVSSTGTVPAGLSNNTTYWVSSFNLVVDIAPGLVQIKLASSPGGADIILSNGSYSGTFTVKAIGVSIDRDVLYITNHGLVTGDMVKYVYPSGGAIARDTFTKDYMYVTKLDNNNIQLEATAGMQVTSPLGTPVSINVAGTNYKYFAFLATGNNTFTVSGTGVMEFLCVGGGGAGGFDMGGGGGAGGFTDGTFQAVSGTYNITVGTGGTGAGARIGGNGGGHQYGVGSTNGTDSTISGPNGLNIRAKGGGFGGSSYFDYSPGASGNTGGSGGGTSGYSNGSVRGGGAANQASAGTTAGTLSARSLGNRGGQGGGQYYSGGGGGAGGNGADSTNQPNGGAGVQNAILGTNYFWAGGGGGSGYSSNGGSGGAGGGGGGAVGGPWPGGSGLNAGQQGGGGGTNTWANTPGGNGGANTGGGGGGGAHYENTNKGGNGGSGIVVVRWVG